MKIELTEKKLKVGKFECKSVTITQIDDYFKLDLYDIKGITERILQYWDDGRPKLKYPSKEQEVKILKLKKRIKVKKVEFIGIVPKLHSKKVNYGGEDVKGKGLYYAENNLKNYINFYKINK